jgi:hypothetical protein
VAGPWTVRPIRVVPMVFSAARPHLAQPRLRCLHKGNAMTFVSRDAFQLFMALPVAAAVALSAATLPSAGQERYAQSTTYAEPTAVEMASALLKNSEVTGPLLMTFMFDSIRARRCGFTTMQGLSTEEGLGILAGCLKVQKGPCRPSSRGYICDFVMILGRDGWEEPQNPGKGRFYKVGADWLASGD